MPMNTHGIPDLMQSGQSHMTMSQVHPAFILSLSCKKLDEVSSLRCFKKSKEESMFLHISSLWALEQRPLKRTLPAVSSKKIGINYLSPF
jgi:hypothetical protein